MKKLATLAAAGLLAAALVIPGSSAVADGPECDHYNHCYGIAHYPTGGNVDGVAVDLWTDCLHLDTPLSDFATHEMWLITNAAAQSWLEAGYERGITAGGDTETFFRWFWAEYTGTTFYSHFMQWASVSTWKQLWFGHYADDTWGIFLDGQYAGRTVQQATAGTYVQVGGETTEPHVYSHGTSRDLYWHPWGASSWTLAGTGIPGATTGVYSVSASAASMEQTSLQGICGSAPAAAPRRQAQAPSQAEVKKTALVIARAHGEDAPSGLQVVGTTRKAAQRAVGAGDKVDSDQRVHLVQLRGSFVGRAPQGMDLPRGNTMTVTVDAATGEVTDTSLGNDRRELGKLGAVKKL